MTTEDDTVVAQAEARWSGEQRRLDEMASLSAHANAATARWLELVSELREDGDIDELPRFLAFRFGITTREAHECLRVAEALQELPATRAAFARGELTFTKVRALTRVATTSSEEALLELASALTASQLERALRAFRRLTLEEARDTHELEYVDYVFADDGSLILRARLAAEDGMVVVKALDAARERVLERRRAERSCDTHGDDGAPAQPFEPERPARVEALVELAEAAQAARGEPRATETRLVVHVDAAALATDGAGRCELDDGPVIAPETARRLGCDAVIVTRVERDGLPVSVGRTRRTVPPSLRRLLQARDDETCCFPGCERQRHLHAHHRRHWAEGGETSLDNLILLCRHHHRLVHEGGYAVEDDPEGGFRFRNRHGVVTPTAPPRPPPGAADELIAGNSRRGLLIAPRTNRNGHGDPMDLAQTIDALVTIAA